MQAMHEREELYNILMTPLDDDDNTITHWAAEGGHVSIFKVITVL